MLGQPTLARVQEADAPWTRDPIGLTRSRERMLRRSADRKRLPPTYLDGDSLGGLFPDILNERGATAIGQALAVVGDHGELMLAHDGTSTASMLAHHLGTGATLQGADVTFLGSATLDELRLELVQERLHQAAYVTQQIDRPGFFQILLLDANGETCSAGPQLQAIAKLASRDAFLPPVQIGRMIELPAPDREHYCQTLIAASRLTTSNAQGVIVSNAPTPAIHAMLTDMAIALQQHQTNVQLVVVDAIQEHARAHPADRTSPADSVSLALTASRASLGLVWHSSSQPPDVLDDTGAKVQHDDIMTLITTSMLDDSQRRATLLDDATNKRLVERQKTPRPRSRLLQQDQEAVAATMRISRAAYAFRHPASHYFSDFHYSENALAAALYVAGLTSADRPLSQLVGALAKQRASDREIDVT